MSAVIAALLRSPLSEEYDFDVIPSYRGARPMTRLVVFARCLVSFARWTVGKGPRLAHVHVAVRGSMYRKAIIVGLARLTRRPVVLQVHAGKVNIDEFGHRIGSFRRFVIRRTLGRADAVVSVSTAGKEALSVLLARERIEVIPNAAPMITLIASPEVEASVDVLFLGGFHDSAKGGQVLVEALPALLELRPATTLQLAGPGEPPAGLPAAATWLGWLDHEAKEAAFARARMFVMPSLSEGMPIALMEAMAHGLPVVASRVGGIPETVGEGEAAAFVEPGDAPALAATIAAVLDDPERRATLSAAALERAARLAGDDVYSRIDDLYRKVLR
jgi:glycosyltransferase involved in cell wall biosynthesis